MAGAIGVGQRMVVFRSQSREVFRGPSVVPANLPQSRIRMLSSNEARGTRKALAAASVSS